jgi:DNA-binding protein YbaB
METYRRITEKVRGALWAHHRRLMPERQFHRILAYVYNNKYEYQIRFDKMTCVGTEWEGKVEVATTPGGHIKRVRVAPEFEDLPRADREKLVVSAYSKAAKQGRDLMQEAEMRVYNQFLRDLKPIVLGIRDNPEFFTVAEDTEELPGMTLSSASSSDPSSVHRTIPYAKSFDSVDVFKRNQQREKDFFASDAGKRWLLTLQGKRYARYEMPEKRVRGSPGAKTSSAPVEVLAPYYEMDEKRLQRRNWQAFMDNKHVAESLWTRARAGDRLRMLREAQRTGRAWHSPINKQATTQW